MTTLSFSDAHAAPAWLDGYADVEPLGRGGLGDVYRAVHCSTGATVAVKVLRDLTDESAAWTRCRRELAALVALGGHAHVVSVIEQLATPGGPALVMEYAPGGSVAGLVERRGPLAAPAAALVGLHAAEALAAAHARGIVHRDVKPHNLLIDAYGQVKLCDFGIAALTWSAEFRARTSAVSVRYASPEELDADATGVAAVGPPSDIYSLGATLLYVTRGVHLELRDRLVEWTPPADDRDDLAPLDRVVAACLHPDPTVRPSADDLLAMLDAVAWQLPERCRSLPVEPTGAVEDLPYGQTVVHPDRPPRPAAARPAAVAQRGRLDHLRARAPRRGFVLAVLAAAGLVGGAVVRDTLDRPDEPSQQPTVECYRTGVASLDQVDCREPHDLEAVITVP